MYINFARACPDFASERSVYTRDYARGRDYYLSRAYNELNAMTTVGTTVNGAVSHVH